MSRRAVDRFDRRVCTAPPDVRALLDEYQAGTWNHGQVKMSSDPADLPDLWLIVPMGRGRFGIGTFPCTLVWLVGRVELERHREHQEIVNNVGEGI